jgi:aminoglycoside 2''-phosphotransferase
MFKFPHGNSGECLLTERRVCEQLKPAVSFQIPKYRYFSEGCPDFPYPIAAYQKLSGIVLERCLLEESFVNAVAIQIGRILSEFHKIPITGELEHMAVPHDPLSHKPDLEGFYHKTRHQVFPHLSSTQRDWTRCLFEEFLDDDRCWRFVPTLIHGDFDSSNILYDPCRGIVCGIIDFEEVGVGDPACDFCSLLDEYGQRFLDQVLQNYTAPIDDCLPKRVEFHARRIIFCEILYGVESGEDEFLEHGMERLHHAIAGDEIIGGWLPKSTSRNRTVAGFPE